MARNGFYDIDIYIYLPVGMNNKHQCITSHMLVIIDATKLNKKLDIYFCYMIFNFKVFYRKKRKYELASFYSFICKSR